MATLTQQVFHLAIFYIKYASFSIFSVYISQTLSHEPSCMCCVKRFKNMLRNARFDPDFSGIPVESAKKWWIIFLEWKFVYFLTKITFQIFSYTFIVGFVLFMFSWEIVLYAILSQLQQYLLIKGDLRWSRGAGDHWIQSDFLIMNQCLEGRLEEGTLAIATSVQFYLDYECVLDELYTTFP